MAETFNIEPWEVERVLGAYFRRDIRTEFHWSDAVHDAHATRSAMRDALLEFVRNRHKCPCGEGFDHAPRGFPWCKHITPPATEGAAPNPGAQHGQEGRDHG